MNINIIVDMQEDFVRGTLANPEAEAIIPSMVEYIKEAQSRDDAFIFTLDLHDKDYLNTSEGRHLPIKHCLANTAGADICHELESPFEDTTDVQLLPKNTFGSLSLFRAIEGLKTKSGQDIDSITFMGTCTDICVITNALLVKTFFPETEIIVYADLCAGLTPELHDAAIKVMQSCQITIKYYNAANTPYLN